MIDLIVLLLDLSIDRFSLRVAISVYSPDIFVEFILMVIKCYSSTSVSGRLSIMYDRFLVRVGQVVLHGILDYGISIIIFVMSKQCI